MAWEKTLTHCVLRVCNLSSSAELKESPKLIWFKAVRLGFSPLRSNRTILETEKKRNIYIKSNCNLLVCHTKRIKRKSMKTTSRSPTDSPLFYSCLQRRRSWCSQSCLVFAPLTSTQCWNGGAPPAPPMDQEQHNTCVGRCINVCHRSADQSDYFNVVF